MGDLCDVKTGPFGTQLHKTDYASSGIPIVEIGDVHPNRNLAEGAAHFVSKDKADQLTRYEIRNDDILFTRVGTVGRCTKVPTACNGWLMSTSLIRVRPRLEESISSAFLLYYFWSPIAQSFAKASSKGTTRAGTNSTIVEELPLALAPFKEQKRIVSKVDELFSFLDASTESLRKVQAQLKRYRQAVLKYAFEGKLTEEWRETHKDQIESAQKLLDRIKQEKRKEPKYREMASINPSELPEIPNSWAWTKLGEILFLSNDRCNPITSENQRFVGLEHIESGTGRLLGFGKSSATRSTKNRFKKGDLLYGKLRPYLNKVWLASFDGVCSTDILVFRKNSFLNNEYLAAFMLNQDFVEYTRQRMSGVQHPRINYTTLSQYILPIPPNAEQVVIAEKIQKTFSITENSEETMLQETKQAEILRQSILKVAFEGRLVPQNSNDESAEELLERIKAERFSNKESKLELPCYVK